MKQKIHIPSFFALFIALLLIAAGIATFLKSYEVGAVGRVVGVRLEIYQDANATTPLNQINWGMVEPDSTTPFACYMKSSSNVPTSLSLTTANWVPSNASTFIGLTWDYDNTTLAPNEIRKVTLALYVSADIEGIDNFSFDIIVSAEKTGLGA